MSALAELLKTQKRVATPANPANAANPSADFSNFSSGQDQNVVVLDPERTRGAIARIEAERERRRREGLAMLEANPEIRRAWLTDDKGHPKYVILVLAIRDAGTAELSIPRESYDAFRLLELIEAADISAADVP